jgi:hypothetical protein
VADPLAPSRRWDGHRRHGAHRRPARTRSALGQANIRRGRWTGGGTLRSLEGTLTHATGAGGFDRARGPSSGRCGRRALDPVMAFYRCGRGLRILGQPASIPLATAYCCLRRERATADDRGGHADRRERSVARPAFVATPSATR